MNDLASAPEVIRFFREAQPRVSGIKVSDTHSPKTTLSSVWAVSQFWLNTASPWGASRISEQLLDYDKAEDIIRGLKTLGLDEVSERLDDLNDICNDEAPDMLPINIDSLRSFALFMVESCKFLPIPEFGVGYEGDLQALWEFGEENSVVMDFLPKREIRLQAVSFSPESPQIEHVVVNGTFREDIALPLMESVMASFSSS